VMEIYQEISDKYVFLQFEEVSRELDKLRKEINLLKKSLDKKNGQD
jgi:hypothetical protein